MALIISPAEEAQWGVLRLKQILRLSEEQALTPAAVCKNLGGFLIRIKTYEDMNGRARI